MPQPAESNAEPSPAPSGNKTARNTVIVLCDICLLIGMLLWLPLEPMVAKGLAILVFIAILWLTEALHVTITALLVPVLAMTTGVMPGNSSLVEFANPTIFLFFGGFVLAGALHEQKIDSWIAAKILAFSKGKLGLSLILIFATTAFLSMWMSNTATAAMMLPLVIGLISRLDYQKYQSTWIFAILGVAYSASIGGMGTLVGSPPNAIAARELGMTFAGWFKIGVPVMIVFAIIVFFLMKLVLKPDLSLKIPDEPLETEDGAPVKETKLNGRQIRVLVIFVITAICWMGNSFVADYFQGVPLDALVALCAAVILPFAGVIDWKGIVRNTDWGVLLLFGGGLTLSQLLQTTGAGAYLASQVTELASGHNIIILLLILSLFISMLTEFCSNTAAAALLCPLMVTLAAEMGIAATPLVLLIGIGASCAFMLPVGTPPNAIAFSTGKVPQPAMIKMGLIINIVLVFVKAGWAYLFWM